MFLALKDGCLANSLNLCSVFLRNRKNKEKDYDEI